MNAMKRFLLGSDRAQSEGGGSSSPSSRQQNEVAPISTTFSSPSGQQQQQKARHHSFQEANVGIKPSPSQHAALSLTHLRKLLTDLATASCSSPCQLSEPEKESRVYCMLPLFCRVFSHCPAAEMLDKFPEVATFCQLVSRLAVSEIRRRASNQSTVAASQAIATFLEMEGDGQDSSDAGGGGQGWMLLTSLNLLSLAGPALIEVMTAASIPSTMVKCLYLFFDLPPLDGIGQCNSDGVDGGGVDAEAVAAAAAAGQLTDKEKRLLLQNLFAQLLVRLCSVPAACEELARKDDLALLFSALSSACPSHNLAWRKKANEVLVVLTRHGLTALVLAYIHNKGCISLCVENMQKACGAAELTPLELVEMLATVFCLLKDSSDVTQTLIDDFRTCHGYTFLTEFILRAEQDGQTESQEALRNVVLLVASLVTCGFHELRPPTALSTGSSQLFQLPNFVVPAPLGRGSSVRNVAAFHVLASVFVKATSQSLASTVLDAVSNVFHACPANYFLLEPHNTLSQFAERIHLKAAAAQEKFFRLLEFVVFQLNYVPCKELISLSLLLRNHHTEPIHRHCTNQCLLFLLAVLRHHAIFKDVYREVGLLEVLVTMMQRFAVVIKMRAASSGQEKEEKKEGTGVQEELETGFLVAECLSVLLVGNANNAAVFRESGGSRTAHSCVSFAECRREALGLVQQLILSPGGDDDMATLLALLQSAPAHDLPLKTDILKSLLTCLRESHRTRTMFRKVGGFVYVMSTLVSMEGCLGTSTDADKPWRDGIGQSDVLRMLHLVFNTLCIAMRYEPANAKFFHLEICGPSLSDTVRLLGCFDQKRTFDSMMAEEEEEENIASSLDNSKALVTSYYDELSGVFNRGVLDYVSGNGSEGTGGEEGVRKEWLVNATLVIRLLYDLAVDAYDRAQQTSLQLASACCLASSASRESKNSSKATRDRHLSLTSSVSPVADSPTHRSSSFTSMSSHQQQPMLVHPGVVLALFQLIPSAWRRTAASDMADIAASTALQQLVTDVIQSLLVHSERNVQILCDVAFPAEILKRASRAISAVGGSTKINLQQQQQSQINGSLVAILEQLGRQALEPKDLREFVRLGDPLNCLLPNPTNGGGGKGNPLPLSRIQSLVAMASINLSNAQQQQQHHHQLHRGSPSHTAPPFVEFDMQPEGFGCLFLPSIAPQCIVGGGGVAGGPSMATTMTGGVGGGGDRIFPAPTGMSYSTWICVDKFSDPRLDPHGIRLLTLVRTVVERGTSAAAAAAAAASASGDDHLVCLSVVLSARDKALLVSTQETVLPKGSSDWEPEVNGDFGARIWNPDLIQEGQWHHLALVWNRAVLKNSQFSLYVDGQLVHSGKMHYISQNPGGGAANLTVASSVFGYIGTAPSWRRQSRLVWRQGPCHLVEDAFNAQVVQWIYRVGPHYVGSLQAPELPIALTGGAVMGGGGVFAIAGGEGDGGDIAGVESSSSGSSLLLCSLVNEDRVMFGLNASAMSPLTLAKIRKVYRKADSRAVAKQLGMSSHENATPIRLLHNAAGHLSGPARTLGGVVIGYLGVRVFCPRPLSTTVMAIGGCNVLLGMVAMSTDAETLYTAVRCLVQLVRGGGGGGGQHQHHQSQLLQREMERIRGYQTLAYLLKQHKAHLDERVLHLAVRLVGGNHGTEQSPHLPAAASGSLAFRDLIADLDVWCETGPSADDALLRSLLDLLFRLSTDGSPDARAHTRHFRDLNLVGRLLLIVQETDANSTTQPALRETLWKLIGWLLHNNPRPVDLLLFGQFLAATLPVHEGESCFSSSSDSTGDYSATADQLDDGEEQDNRSDGLTLLHKLLLVSGDRGVNQMFADELVRVLGFDWLLLFAQPHIRSSTVIQSLRCLVNLLSCAPLLAKFRSTAAESSGWTRSREIVSSVSSSGTSSTSSGGGGGAASSSQSANSGGGSSGAPRLVARTFSVAVSDDSALASPGQSASHPLQPPGGFQLLGWILVNHTSLPQVYHLLIGLMAGRGQPKISDRLDSESVWNCLFGSGQQQQQQQRPSLPPMHCPEAVVTLLTMIRALMNPEDKNNSNDNNLSPLSSSSSYPNVLLQLLFHVYNNAPDYMSVFMTAEVINALVACLFPLPGGPGGTAGGGLLTDHPAKKTLMDFLRTIVVDSLSLPAVMTTGSSTTGVSSGHQGSSLGGGGGNVNNGKFSPSLPVIDSILDACPDSASYTQQCQFQTELLSTVLDHLTTGGVQLLGDQSVLAVAPVAGAAAQHMAPNVFYLAGRLVDKLWQGILLIKDPQRVLDFCVQLIAQAKKNRSSSTTTVAPSSTSSSAAVGLVPLDNIYRSLNRCVLFLLSRPADSVAQHTGVLETLHKLATHRSLVFGSGNHDLEFIGCLTYCLLQLTIFMKISTEPRRTTTWHVNPDVVPADGLDLLPDGETLAGSGQAEAQHLSSIAAQRVWEELYVAKKPAVEESLRVATGANTQNRAPVLADLANSVGPPALKLWLNYIEAERRSTYRTQMDPPHQQISNQIQSKIQKVTGGLTRLTSRSLTLTGGGGGGGLANSYNSSNSGSNKSPKYDSTDSSAPWAFPGAMGDGRSSWADVWLASQLHLRTLKEQLESDLSQRRLAKQHSDQFQRLNWQRTEESELLRLRGLWGPTQESHLLTKWMLDMTEGPCRMRKKLTPNLSFYANYPYRPDLELPENKSLRYKVAVSHDAKDYYKLFIEPGKWRKSLLPSSVATATEPPPAVVASAAAAPTPLSNSRADSGEEPEMKIPTELKDLPICTKKTKEDQENEEELEEPAAPIASKAAVGAANSNASNKQPQDWQNLLRLLEENDKISHLFRCARVQGLETVDGLLLFGKEHLYVVDGFTQTPSREIRDISNFPSGTFEPIVPPYTTPGYNIKATTAGSVQQQRHECSRLSYDEVREVHKRRYLLQPIALEIFSQDGRNHLLAFPPNGRNKVYQRLLATATGLSDSASQSVAGQKRAANVEQSAGILSTVTAGIMGETSVTQRWVRGELSNFQYLMHLNTLAGRSYNDLMQYPVFPWILADYESDELDLSKAETFRDLSKPMGAQTVERLQQFRKRYKEWDDPHNETGPYHYGTHYSSAMIVCSYLVRLEPFTQQFLQLQGGHFDLADRLFHSVRDAWLSASHLNMSDVKELIPEFFYLPDLLVNGNKFDLGCKQSGVQLGDVQLPPWAKDDPREFIRLHRAALESDYVSSHLHEWIDLIFGHKQQGPAAVEAVNLYHPLFYEGNVDIYSIEDPLKKNAVIGFINNFGQTPKQLFKKPHPMKKVAGVSGSGSGSGGVSNRISGLDIGLMPLAAGQAAIQQMTTFLPGGGSTDRNTSDGRGAALAGSPTTLASTGVASDYVDRQRLFFHHVDHLSPSLQAIKELKRPVGQMIGAERSSSSSLLLAAVEENKCLIPPNYSRCVAWGYADHSLRLVPHDSDRALLVCETPYHQEILTCVCPTSKTVVTGSANTVVTVWDLGKKQFTVRQHLYGHTEAVTCLAASAGYQLLVSGSRDRTAIIWDLSRLTFVGQLSGHSAPLAAIAINELTGDIATCSGTWLHLWSINGDPLASVNTLVGQQMGRSQHILCVCFSQYNEWDPMNAILTGSTDGVVRMWSLDYVQVPKEEEPPATVQTSAAATGVTPLKAGEDEEDDEEESEDEGVEEAQQQQQDEEKKKEKRAGIERQASIKSGDSQQDEGEEMGDEMKTSRSDTSLNDVGSTFEVITESEVRESQPATSVATPPNPPLAVVKKSRHVLKEGFKWQRQLIFRTKLTMHTAYDRQDNSEPASITAIAILKDHRTVLVGDARGRIHSWSVTDISGRSMADHWLRDDTADSCNKCRVRFSLTERRHHCRNCGHLFCSRCSRYESEIMQLRIRRPVRVCQDCFVNLKSAQADS